MPSKKYDRLLSLPSRFILVAFASAVMVLSCSAEPQKSPSGVGVHGSVQAIEQCSIFGTMACRAVTLMSGEGFERSTCSAYRGRDGTRVETCGADYKSATTIQRTTTSKNYPVRLSWNDNSDNETDFVIERCDRVTQRQGQSETLSCAGEWKRVGTVDANITSYVDQTAFLNQTYLYRVKASNTAGNSNYTSEVLITTPKE
jgi:hypothetical protein